MNKYIVAGAVFLSFAMHASSETITIKGYSVGMRFPTDKPGFSCSKSPKGGVSCSTENGTQETIGGAPIDSMFVRMPDGETVEYIAFYFDSNYYASIRSAVAGKYKNIKCSRSQVETSMGVKRENEECIYIGDNDVFSLSRYDGKITRGSLFLTRKPQPGEMESKEASKAKDI